MYTYCSHCQRQQRVSAKQLRRHRGLLICKQCGERFDALAALTDKPAPKLTRPGGKAYTPPESIGSAHTRTWQVGGILAAIVLLLQVGYFEGWRLLRSPYVHGWMLQACAHLSCNVPKLSNPDDWSVSHGELQPYLLEHYRFTAALTLQSEFAQPLPKLKLTLLGFNGLPLAERVFAPEQYANTAAVETGETTRDIQLWLAKPPAKIGGFTVNVL